MGEDAMDGLARDEHAMDEDELAEQVSALQLGVPQSSKARLLHPHRH